MRSASPSSVSAPQWPNNSAATRVGSADGRPAQWTGSTGSSRSFAKVSTLGALDASSTQPSSHLAPSWSSSPRTAVLAGSASRSWSQSSQGRRVEPLSPWVSQASVPTSALQANQPSEKDSGTASPHPQTSRRAPSHTYLQAVGAGQNGGMKPSSLPDGHYEAQMANLRNSLLQHIQSVQKEITRLQLERQRAQTQGTSPAVSERQQSANVLQTNGQVATAAPAIAVALCSPQSTSRGVSSERERSGGDSSGYRWRRQHQIRRDSNAMGSGQAPSSVGSKDRLPPEVSCQPPTNEYVNAVTKVQRFWRRETGRRRRRTDALPSSAAAPRQSRGAASRSSGRDSYRESSWGRRSSRLLGRDGRPFVAIHHAACRIQRAWRVSRWRRRFLDFAEREIGWVGTLDWLQHHNLLYGTELADPEDVRWWMTQRQGAPLDREVDPWGCTKLRDHLNKMWYGRSVEEVSPEEAHARAQAEYLEVQYLKAQYLEAAERDQRYEQRFDEVYLRGGEQLHSGREAYLLYESGGSQAWGKEAVLGHGRSAPAAVDSHGRSYSQGLAMTTLRSPASTDRALDIRSASLAGAIGGAVGSSRVSATGVAKATSLSPRRAATQLATPDGEMSSRRSQALAAPPPSMHASYQASPPQTHRAPRTAHSPVNAVSSALPATALAATAIGTSSANGNSPTPVGGSVSASLRPRSPVAAQRVQGTVQPQGRLSLTGNAGVPARAVSSVHRQSPGLGRALSGSPPPSLLARASGAGSHGAAATTRK